MVSFSKLTTIGVGGPIKNYIQARHIDEIIYHISQVDKSGNDVLVVGGGSNILAGDKPFNGTVLHILSKGYIVKKSYKKNNSNVYIVEVQAGQTWDSFIRDMSNFGCTGLEGLSGIPGTVGAAPIQNIGAYGVDASNFISKIFTWDRKNKKKEIFYCNELGFSYRSSILKDNKIGYSSRYIVLSVEFRLEVLHHESMCARNPRLVDQLNFHENEILNSRKIRKKILNIRKAKGMVLDCDDRDTYSTGSFFINPVVDNNFCIPERSPVYSSHIQGTKKLSAAWLINYAGFKKGFGLPGPASLSTKHSLAITNRGNATADDILYIAKRVQSKVYDILSINLEVETNLINCSL